MDLRRFDRKVREADQIIIRPSENICANCKILDLAAAFWQRRDRLDLSRHPSFASLAALRTMAPYCDLCTLILYTIELERQEYSIRHGHEKATPRFSSSSSMECRLYDKCYSLWCTFDNSQFSLIVSTPQGKVSLPLPDWNLILIIG